ncbi:hypothetical protein DM02DRAFT_663392 [Periconia macrospinosa]|uniref:Rhodopsin domain-containing protein n=1 Tax=Periconia macrospinosa TaxID=97972 RepID=A0A2V1D1V9_9PLEO|nr:hypothetical protein DM02DRAFT_663392 [Periconia macrospinosa]
MSPQQQMVPPTPEQMAALLNGPTIPSPNGFYQLDDPPNGNHIAIPVTSICCVLSAMFFLVRFYAKISTKKYNSSDYLTAIAFPLYWVYIYYTFKLSWTPGFMINMWNIRLRDISDFSWVCWIATNLYLVIIALVKCAILLEWVNLFVPRGQSNYFSWISYATCVAISLYSIILFSMNFANCTPFESNWNQLSPNRFCRFKVPHFALASAIVNSILDVVPLLLAQKVIWGLKLPNKKKLGVSIMFLVGIIGFASALLRVVYAVQFMSSPDVSYYFSIMGLLSLCETTCTNIILCVPFLPKLVKSFQESTVFLGVRSRLTTNKSSGGGGITSKSGSYVQSHELPRINSSRTDRLLHSSSTDRNTMYSTPSGRYVPLG